MEGEHGPFLLCNATTFRMPAVKRVLVKHIGFGALACIAVAAMVTGIWLLPGPKTERPEDVVPADRTIPVLHVEQPIDLQTLFMQGADITASGGILMFETKRGLPREAVSGSIPLAFEHPLLVIGDAAMSSTLARLSSALPAPLTEPITGALRAELQDLFGEDLSPTHDLLPLLKGNALLQLGKNGSGTTAIFLEGSVTDRTATEARLSLLHLHFQEILPGSDEIHRTFEHGQTFDDLRESSGAVIQTTRHWNEWEIHETRSVQSGRHFVTALSSDRFLASTSGDAVDAFLQEKYGHRTLSLTPPGGIRIGGGLIDIDAMRDLITFFLPRGVSLPSMHGIYRWSVVQNGKHVTVRVHNRM